jgi:hypothetical protein
MLDQEWSNAILARLDEVRGSYETKIRELAERLQDSSAKTAAQLSDLDKQFHGLCESETERMAGLEARIQHLQARGEMAAGIAGADSGIGGTPAARIGWTARANHWPGRQELELEREAGYMYDEHGYDYEG